MNGYTYLTKNPDKCCIDTPLSIDRADKTDTVNLHITTNLNNILQINFNTETRYLTHSDNTFPVMKIPIFASSEAPLSAIPLRI